MKSYFAVLATLLLSGTIGVLPAQLPPTIQFDYWNWYAVKAPMQAQGILVDATSDSTWYVASNTGLYITRDGGGTWTQSLTTPVAKEAIAADPVNPNRIYVGAGASIYLSTDHGLTWTKSSSFSQQVACVFVSPTDESVWVGPRTGTGFAGLYRSQDQGSTWTPVPYGASFSAINTTLDIVEDGSGWLWAATQASPLTPGKLMLIRSADRGATWVDNSIALTAPPTKLVWDGTSGAMYMATNGGVMATGNQGTRWVYYLRSAALTVAIAGVPGSLLAVPGVLAGLDATGGGGAAFAFTMLHRDVIDPNTIPSGFATPIGLQGTPVQALVLNQSGTRFVSVGTDGGIRGGTVFLPQVSPSVVTVAPGSSLVVGCQTCPIGPAMSISIAGQTTALVMDPPPGPYSISSQHWDVPATLPYSTYPAQLLTTFPPIGFTVIVAAAPPAPAAITAMESVRFGVKPQYGVGEVVSLFGTGLTGQIGSGSAPNLSTTVPLAMQLALCQVLVDGAPAPLYYAYTGTDGHSQINFQIPYSLAPGTHTLRVNRFFAGGLLDTSTADFSFTVAAVSPTYMGDPVTGVYIQDITQGPAGSVFATAATPAHPGDAVTIYATGLGATTPTLQTGAVPPPGVLAKVAAPVSISVWDGGIRQWPATLIGAVASPQYPGLYQIAFQFPAAATPNGTTINLIVAVGADTQTIPVAFSR